MSGIFDILPESENAPVELKRARRRSERVSPDVVKLEKLPPYAHEIEQAVLGCMLLSPNECIPQVISKFKAGEKVFYDLRHQIIYNTIVNMSEMSRPIDAITVMQRLQMFDQLDEIGGISYLNALQDSTTSTANILYYAGILVDTYLMRKLVSVSTETIHSVYESQNEVSEILDAAERDVLAIRAGMETTESYGMRELVQGSISEIETWMQRQGAVTGLPTGFVDFDIMTGGLQPGEMIIIAARPSMGKTSLAMNIAENIAVGLNLPVGVFSLEMTKEALTTRMICSQARVNIRNAKEGFLADRDFPALTSAAGRLSNSLIRIDDTSGLSILSLRARARTMWQQYGVKAFVIDYLQLLHSTTKRARDNRQQEISEISSGIKALAKDLRVPVIVLSQLNREVEREKNRKPRLSDLRESGSLEQDADVVGLLYIPKLDDDEALRYADAIPVNLLIAKQRNGPTGEVNLTFIKPYTRFESASKISDEDVPGDVDSVSRPTQQSFLPPPPEEREPT